MKKITQLTFLLLTFLSFNSVAGFYTLSTEQVQAKIKQGVAIIDVRRIDEYNKYGIIPNAHKLTFFDAQGKYDTQKWLKDLAKIVPTKDTPFVLVCAHANRSKTIGKFLAAKTDYKNIYELAGGINYGWIDKGLATTKIPAKNSQNTKNTNNPWYKFW